MNCAIEMTQEWFKQVQDVNIFQPKLIEQDSLELVRDSFVDEIYTEGSQKDVDRIRGNSDGCGTIPRLLHIIGLRSKALVHSGSAHVETNKKLSGCV